MTLEIDQEAEKYIQSLAESPDTKKSYFRCVRENGKLKLSAKTGGFLTTLQRIWDSIASLWRERHFDIGLIASHLFTSKALLEENLGKEVSDAFFSNLSKRIRLSTLSSKRKFHLINKLAPINREFIHDLSEAPMTKASARELREKLADAKGEVAKNLLDRFHTLHANWKEIEQTDPDTVPHVIMRRALFLEHMAYNLEPIGDVSKKVFMMTPHKMGQMQIDRESRSITFVARRKKGLFEAGGTSKVCRVAMEVFLEDRTRIIPLAYRKTRSTMGKNIDAFRKEAAIGEKLKGCRGCDSIKRVSEHTALLKRDNTRFEQLVTTSGLCHGDGDTLAKKSLSTDQQLDFCEDILYGMMAHHQRNIFHGDLKLGNILYRMDPDGKVHGYITDWGLSEEVQPGGRVRYGGNYNRGLYGSAWFTDPALLRGNPSDPLKKELFAVGFIFDQLLKKGHPPEWYAPINTFLEEGCPQNKRAEYANRVAAMVNERRAELENLNPDNLKKDEIVPYLIYRLYDPDLTKRPSAEEALNILQAARTKL